MENTNKFEAWLNKINEDLAQEPTINSDATSVAEPNVADAPSSDRDAMMHDIDTIMTSLETLASELREEFSKEETFELNEDTNTEALAGLAKTAGATAAAITAAVGVGTYKLIQKAMDAKVRGPKAAQTQAKVDTVSKNIAQMEIAKDAAKVKGADSKKLEALAKRIEMAKEQRDKLQDQVDAKYADASQTIQTHIQNQKIKSKMAIAELQLGQATDAEKQELKDRIQKYKENLEHNANAMKDLQPDENEIKKAEKEAAKAQKQLKDKNDTPKDETPEEAPEETQAEETPKDSEEETTTTTTTTTTSAEETEEETPEETQEDPKAAAIKAKIKEYEDAISQLSAKKDKASKDKIGILQAAVNSEKAKLDKLTAKESLMYRALGANLNELAEEIATKLEWQVAEGTALHTRYNTIIRRAENDNQLNERLHVSVKDRFRNLL